MSEFPGTLPVQAEQKPAGNHVTLDSVRAAYATLAAQPRPPKCIAVAPDVMDRLRSTAWPDPPAGVLNPLLGIPLVVDEELPPGTVEPRDEFPPSQAVNG